MKLSLHLTRPIIIFNFNFRIHKAKSRPSTPKRQRCVSSAISSSMFLLLLKSVTWFSHYCCGLPLLLLPCGGREFDSRLWCGLLSSLELFHGIYKLGVSVFHCPLSMFRPVLSSEEAPALCWPLDRGSLPVVSVFIMYPWNRDKRYK